MALVVMERQAIEDELEDLKLSAVAEGEEKVNEIIEKRMSKMKKKYEKKIAAMRADLVEAAEVRTPLVLTISSPHTPDISINVLRIESLSSFLFLTSCTTPTTPTTPIKPHVNDGPTMTPTPC